GSDYPFDMGMPEGVSQVRGLPISEAGQSAILGGRARALLGAARDKARAFAVAGGRPPWGRERSGKTEDEKNIAAGGAGPMGQAPGAWGIHIQSPLGVDHGLRP